MFSHISHSNESQAFLILMSVLSFNFKAPLYVSPAPLRMIRSETQFHLIPMEHLPFPNLCLYPLLIALIVTMLGSSHAVAMFPIITTGAQSVRQSTLTNARLTDRESSVVVFHEQS